MMKKDIFVWFLINLTVFGCALTPQPRYHHPVQIDTELIDNKDIIETTDKNDTEITEKLSAPIETTPIPDTITKQDNSAGSDLIRIIATGDLMLGTRIPDESYLPELAGNELFSNQVKEVLRKGDAVFGNLEGAICGSGGQTKDKKYVFAMPDETAKWLADAGYNLLSVANNHAHDMGEEGAVNTRRLLEENGINFAGYLDYPAVVFEKKGIRFGFIACSPNAGVVNLHNLEWLKSEVRKLALQCDIVIVSMHIGAEGKDHQQITRETEFFMGENRGNPYRFAREMIDAGADLVLGHGPHVTRAIDIYKGKFIAYSLGNFCTVSRVNLSGVNGIAPILDLSLDREGNFLFGKIHSTCQIARKGVRMDAENRALAKIIELTIEDFPDSGLHITEDGLIIPAKL